MTRPLTQDELQQVLDHYALGEIRGARRVERGFVNENWRLGTTQGCYFLKRRHPSLHDPDVIRAQHALMVYLRQAGFPAPALLPTGHGETLLILDGEFYEIQEYIEGELYDHDRPAHFEAAARTLGYYHLLAWGFASQSLRESGDLYSPATLRANLDGLANAWDLARNASPCGEAIRQLEADASNLAVRFAGHDKLPRLVTHGDYYAGNLLFQGDRIVGVVDYDKARWQPRVVELAEALIYFASPRPGHTKYLVYPGFLQWEPFERFLRHYARTIALEEGEIHALPDYIRCIWLQVSLLRLWEKGARPPEAPEALREVLALGNWAETNTGKMIELCKQAIQDA